MQALAADPTALKYTDGIALHWYDYEGTLGLDNVQAAQALAPGVPTVATEACYLQSLTETWATGAELVAIDALGDIAFNTSGWTFWNAVLHTGYPTNYNGGPQHGGGDGLSGPIFFNQAQNGAQSLVFQSSFWAMGQISRYARPGAVRVTAAGPGFASSIADFEAVRATIINNKPPPAGGLPLVGVAFEDDAAGIGSVVVLNAGPTDVTFKLADAALGAAKITVGANSIVSYRYLLN
jgi:O-glycosyl hydrolase